MFYTSQLHFVEKLWIGLVCLHQRQIQLCLSIYKDCHVAAVVVKLFGGGED